jgi:crotonobetainyl-CoA:carnitine CoA-transferase CaiB-like acyl-CoA transferase
MAKRPMDGVRVLEVAQFTYVPSAGAVLADWGAQVIKVEHARHGDAQRGFAAYMGAVAGGGRFAPIMEHPNRGKRSLGLALETPEGLELLLELARRSDVFLTNFLPDARRRLRIDVDDIRAVNPDIVYVRGSGLGALGAESEKGGYDQATFWGRGGSADGVTPPDLEGVLGMPAGAYGDTLGGLIIAGGIASALFARQRTGETSIVDVSLLGVGTYACALSVDLAMMTGDPWKAAPVTRSAPPPTRNPLIGFYRTADDRYLMLSMMQPAKYWVEVCEHLDRKDWLADPRFATPEAMMDNGAAAAVLIREEIGKRTLAQWIERLRSMDGQWAPVQNSVEVARDPQVRANGLIRPVIDVDGNPRELVVNPVMFDETPVDTARGPQFAEHTDEILRELGLGEARIAALKAAGAINESR